MKLPAWLHRRLLARAKRLMASRPHDFLIGVPEDPYLFRWYVIPRNRVFNIYLHLVWRSDDDRALHDHPWLFNASLILDGGYREVLPGTPGGDPRGPSFRMLDRAPRCIVARGPFAAHRLKLHGERGSERPAITLFLTGPRVRPWGFWCAQGWRHQKDFIAKIPGGNAIGRGCD